jgi:hypothetical protein
VDLGSDSGDHAHLGVEAALPDGREDAGGDVTYETEWATVGDFRAREEPLYPERLEALLTGDADRIVT